MESRCFYPLLYSPFYSSVKDCMIVFIHSKNKTCIDHYSYIMKSLNRQAVIPVQVLNFILKKASL